jgi:hypothetical protein
MRLHDLPDDILIAIFCLVDVDTVLSLRLVCKGVSAVIDGYVKTIAPASARNTFVSSPLLLTQQPETGYTVKWLRNLIPAYLAAVALDKDKLRRHCYINAGFPYGIPYEDRGAEAAHWRSRVANGWRVFRCFYLISRDVYAKLEDKEANTRPKWTRKMSGGASRAWLAVSCPYQGCDEHGMKHLFTRRKSNPACFDSPSTENDVIEDVRRKESLVLKKRLQYLKTLKERDLLDYTYVLRLLLWVFRPYRKPGVSVMESVKGWNWRGGVPQANWQAEISAMSFGHSWLGWCMLHLGTTPFWTQWSSISHENYMRHLVWETWSRRSHHQIEVEREHICKFELAVRKRCLSSERIKRLESEILKGRTVTTISLDCIPWEYDQPSIFYRPPTDFSWYKPGAWIWMDGNIWLRVGGGQGDMRILKSKGKPEVEESSSHFEEDSENPEEMEGERGPLEHVPFLVYLGVEDAEELWGTTDLSTTGDMVF